MKINTKSTLKSISNKSKAFMTKGDRKQSKALRDKRKNKKDIWISN